MSSSCEDALEGSIPACAGKPSRRPRARPGRRVHPRVCGEAQEDLERDHPGLGPSPRVRGSLGQPAQNLRAARSIPACAGKPCPSASRAPVVQVHPRVCGEAAAGRGPTAPGPGPSPRVRGSPSRGTRGPPGPGSIPACAGKPPFPAASRRKLGVHPRVCGEASPPSPLTPADLGPSPRVRGSRRSQARRASRPGSIPACAGKPEETMLPDGLPWVHPRVCGEAMSASMRRMPLTGPSPRVRGSRQPDVQPAAAPGSIPACAGKPRPVCRSEPRTGVHPRVCGEAPAAQRRRARRTGPSPRVRGSLGAPARPGCRAGSIPACAGKPPGPRCAGCPLWVHPRVCGEALSRLRRTRSGSGPSPRVRGSPAAAGRRTSGDGSIPACAGKPRSISAPAAWRGVHPRVCGEATSWSRMPPRASGPSPRVRGSRRL